MSAASRCRTVELFEFDYQLEMYKPAARTSAGGTSPLPMHGNQDRLAGKLDWTSRCPADRAPEQTGYPVTARDQPYSG